MNSVEKLQEKEQGSVSTVFDKQMRMLQIAIDRAADSIFWIRRDASFYYANQTACQLLGYTPEEILTLTVPDIDPNFTMDMQTGIWEQIKQHGGITFEAIHQRKDGTTFPVEVRANFIELDGQEFVYTFDHDISERKQAEEALRKSEEQYRLVLDATQVGIWDWDIQTGRAYYNDQWITILGYAPGELKEHVSTWESLLHPDDKDDTLNLVTASMQRKDSSFVTEFRMRTRSGGWKWIEARGNVVEYDEQGTALRMVGTHVDITERKQAEEELVISKHALDGAFDAIEWIDSTGHFFYVNETDCRQLGYTREELLTMGVADIDPNFPIEAWGEVWTRIKQEGSIQFETLHQRKDGSVFPVEVIATYMQALDREWSLSIVRDISERKRAEESLHDAQSMLRLVIDNLPQRVFWKSHDLTYLGCNKQFAHDAGLASTDEIIGKTDYDMPWVDQVDAYRADDEAVMEQNTARYNYEEPIQKADGSYAWLNTSKIPMRNNQGGVVAVLGMYEDISDRKRAEEELVMGKHALDGAFDAIEWIDHNGKFFYVNETDCRQLGYTREELLTMQVADIDPNNPVEIWDNVWEQIKTAGSVQVETLHRRKDGSIFPVDITLTYMYMQNREWGLAIVRDTTERKQSEEELQTFKAVVDTSPDAVGIASPEGLIIYANPAFRDMFGYGDETIGKGNLTLFTEEEQRERLPHIIQTIITKGSWTGTVMGQRKDGSTFPAQVSGFSICDSQGNIRSLPAVIRDMSEHHAQEAERAALQEQIIRAQQAVLHELSAPILPIAPNVLALPLVGTIDSGRAQQIMESLLSGINTTRANLAIIDLTGVKMVDTQVAQALIRTAQAARLLGTQVILTGIQPQIAQTLVHLGADLSGIATRSTLQSGIAYALTRNEGNHR